MNGRLWFYATIVALTLSASVSTLLCSHCDDAFRAVLKLRNWRDLNSTRQRYPDCDDGGVGEGYADFVVHTLATRWSTLNQLTNIVGKDPSFLEFVVRHIDATADTDDLKKIRQNAQHLCPRGAAALCVSVSIQAIAALAEAA